MVYPLLSPDGYLPDGIGPDDARIYRSFKLDLEDIDYISEKSTIFVMVTSDKGLARVIQRVNPDWICASFVISREDYIAVCLSAL